MPDNLIVSLMTSAQNLARSLYHEQVGSDHFLMAMLTHPHAPLALFDSLGVDHTSARQALEESLKPGPKVQIHGDLPQSPELESAVAQAERESDAFGNSSVQWEHLLLAMVVLEKCTAGQMLRSMGLRTAAIRDVLAPAPTVEGRSREWAEQVLRNAWRTAPDQQTAVLGSAYLLLGLLTWNKSWAAEILNRLGISHAQIEAELKRRLISQQ